MITISKKDAYNVSQIILNNFGNYTAEIPDDWLESDVRAYNQLTGENLTINEVRENFINAE